MGEITASLYSDGKGRVESKGKDNAGERATRAEAETGTAAGGGSGGRIQKFS